MKSHTTILSGGKTLELFKQLKKSNPTKIANAQCNYVGVSLTLRYCWVREYHGWTKKFGQMVTFVPTGGLVLSWNIEGIPAGYSKVSSGKVRIKSDTLKKQQKTVSRAISRIVRMAHEEKLRMLAVQALDDLCRPFIKDTEFLSFVEKWEKLDGKTSDYQSLSRADAETWKTRIENYIKATMPRIEMASQEVIK